MHEHSRHHPFWLVELAVAAGAFAFLIAGDHRTVLQDSDMSDVARAMPSLDQALMLWSDVSKGALACVTSPALGRLQRTPVVREVAAAASPATWMRQVAQAQVPALCP